MTKNVTFSNISISNVSNVTPSNLHGKNCSTMLRYYQMVITDIIAQFSSIMLLTLKLFFLFLCQVKTYFIIKYVFNQFRQYINVYLVNAFN